MDLVTKFWNFCHTLRHEGVDYSDYVEELTYLLFLKLSEERKINVPTGCNWNNLLKTTDEKLLTKYNKILLQLAKSPGILGSIFSKPIAKIRTAASLRKLLNLIDGVKWSSYTEDILGAMFEGLLEKAANESKKGAGQYFTPRPLIEAIVEVMKPDPFEDRNFTVSDVACGTGGFLIASYDWWKEKNKNSKLSQVQNRKLTKRTYYGQELVVRPRRLAQMNLYLHGIEPQIKLGDTIYEPFDGEKYSCILTNPPFGTKGSSIPARTDFPISTSNKQLNFIQHVVNSLKKNGRAAIVLPDSALVEEKAKEIWATVTKECNVHTILKLPSGTFSPYANVEANVVFLQKGLSTNAIWIYDARSNIKSITKRGRPISKSYFKEFIEFYGNDPNGNGRHIQKENVRHRLFSINEIQQNGFQLNLSTYNTKKEFKTRKEIIANPTREINSIIDNLEKAIEDLREISQLINATSHD